MNENFKKLKKHFMSYFVSNFIPIILNLFTVYIFTSIITPEQYGEYNINLTTFTIITMFVFEWIGHGVLRFLPRYDKEKNNNLFYNIFRYLLILTVIVSGVYLLSISIKIIYITNIFFVGLLYILTSGLIIIANSIIKSKLQANVFLKSSLLQACIYSIVSCFLLILFDNYIYILIAKIISNSIGVIFLCNKCNFLKKHIINNKKVLEFDQLKQVFLYGFPIILTGIGAMGLKIGDRYIIKYLLGDYYVGLYTSNYMISENITMILFGPIMIASHSLLISLYENEQWEELKKMIIQIKKVILLIFIPIMLYIFIFYKNTSKIFIAESFTIGSYIIPIVLLGTFFYNYSLYNLKIYEFKLESIKITKIILVCFGINIILNIFLIKSIGIIGAALSTTICYILFFVVSIWVSRKERFLNKVELSYKAKLLCTNFFLLIFWMLIKNIFNIEINSLSYFKNLLFIIFSALPIFLFYIFINFKILKIKI